SLALTVCAPNPIGLRTLNNPKWALDHEIAPPSLTFDSKGIVERHVNSLLFGIFTRDERKQFRGLNIKENVEKFFFTEADSLYDGFLKWLEGDLTSYQTAMKELVRNTPLEFSNYEHLISMVQSNFTSIVESAFKLQNNYDEKLARL